MNENNPHDQPDKFTTVDSKVQSMEDFLLRQTDSERQTLSLPSGSSPSTRIPVTPPSVAGYDVLGELGRGGMGVVYKAQHQSLRRVVALKMILAGAHAGSQELARFRTEAEAAARLQHPNIVQIYEVGESETRPFLSLEFCSGGSLESKLKGPPMPLGQAAKLVETLARAIHAAHQAGIVHRDLKPANILLAADGTPKITDFGLAKLLGESTGQTASGAVLGTPTYMAPEQAAGKTKLIGPQTDIYALGVILYELLTGQPPFKASTALDIIMKVVSEQPVPPRKLSPHIPRDLETICLQCLQKEPSERYASSELLADDLRRFASGQPIQARPAGRMEKAWRWCRRNPAALAVIVLLACLASTIGVMLSSNGRNQLAGAGPPPAQETSDTSTPIVRPVRTEGEKFAFLVGVRDYQSLGGGILEFTEADVEELARVLNKNGFRRENIRLLTQWTEADNPALAPTGANIRKQLRGLLDDCIAADQVIVTLTGMGGNVGDPAMYAYLPSDAKLKDANSLISQAELYQMFANCRADSKLLLVDTCQHFYPGDFSLPRLGDLPRGFAAFFACAPGENSYETSKIRHGVFSFQVIQGLGGAADTNHDGNITLDELVKFTRDGVKELVKTDIRTEVFDAAQTPTLLSSLPGKTRIIGRKSDKADPGIGKAPEAGAGEMEIIDAKSIR